MTDALERMTRLEADHHATDRRMSEGFAARDKMLEAALTSRDKALEVALSSLTAHLAVMNEFRGAMNDQQVNYITRAEHATLAGQIADLRLSMRGIANEYVPKIDMSTQEARTSAIERAIADLHTRYATVAMVISAGIVAFNVIVAWWKFH